MTIARGGTTFSVTITRAEIHINSVRATAIGDIFYVRIYQFGASTSKEFADALKAGLPGAKGMVLDLRDDPGGYISAADDVISQFVTSGETFELRGRNGEVERHEVNRVARGTDGAVGGSGERQQRIRVGDRRGLAAGPSSAPSWSGPPLSVRGRCSWTSH